MAYIVKFDANNQPFKYPPCILPKAEYSKIVSEINTNYHLYENNSFCIHYSLGSDDNYYMYFFENHGYNDYNITEKFKY